MKRIPCSAQMPASASLGSMTTMRERSTVKCRRISGSVPRPMDPKPIITRGPSIEP
jgi:hypothetical protein